MPYNRRLVLRKVRWTLTAAMAGGSLFGACEIRIHDAVVGGSKDFLSSVLTSEEVLQDLFPFFFPPSDEGSGATTGQ